MEILPQSIRYALRRLRQSPGFALTAILTLAFGIGATTAIFSIVEGVLLRPLPFPHPDRLVMLGDILEGVPHKPGEPTGTTAPGMRIYMRDTHSFLNLGGYRPSSYELSGVGDPAQIVAARLTAGVFPALGVSPVIGRVFTQREDETAAQVAVLSYQTWQERFHGDKGITGRKILLDRKPYEIIGVMPRDFEFPLKPGQLDRSELWVPMSFTQAELTAAGDWGYTMVGRLKPGITPAQAQADAVPAAREIMRNFPPGLAGRRIHPAVQLLNEVTVAQARPLIRTLFLAVMVVLFVACANLAGLLLVRVIRRRREISVRLALGASWATILRESLIDALALSASGGLLGLALAAAALRLGVSFLPEDLPRIGSIRLDWHVVAFALGLAALTGLLCGLIPAAAAARTGVSEALKDGGRTGTGGSGHARLRSALVVAELAVALVLLSSAGLLLRSFEKMRTIDLGFRAAHTLTAEYALPKEQYSTQAAIDAFNQAVLTRLEQLPGGQAAGITSLLPAAGVQYLGVFTPEGYVPPKGAGLCLGWIPAVMGNYFEAQGISILRGRDFTPADKEGAPLVAIVNRALAEHYWPGQDPIGKRLHRGPAEAKLPWMTVVGEIGGVKQLADEPMQEQIYMPSAQFKADAGSFAPPGMLTGNNGYLVLRGQMAPEQMAGSLRAVVRAIDPHLPLIDVESMDQVIQEGRASRRFNTVLISAFAVAAVLLALLGIYSVIAFSTAMRAQEMAIRLALGAGRSGILRLVIASGARLGLLGCGIGVAGAFFAARLLRSLLFDVDPLDPAVLTLAAVVIFLLAILACVIPARRAAAIEPMEALRAE